MHNLREIELEAKELINQYCPDFSLGWMNKKRVLGDCNHGRKLIRLSKFHSQNNDRAVTRNTILHEIAHAIVGPGHGHNNVWKRACLTVGAKPERCARVEEVGHTWEMHCKCTVHKRYRKPKASTVKYGYCVKCKGGLILKRVG